DRRTCHARGARRLLPHAHRRARAAAADGGAASDRAGRAGGRLVPAEAQPARVRGGRCGDRRRAWRQPAGRQPERRLRLTAAPGSARKILVTRPEPGATQTAARLAAMGLIPILAPALEIVGT